MARRGQQSVQDATLKNKVIHVQHIEAGVFLISQPFLYALNILHTMEVESTV